MTTIGLITIVQLLLHIFITSVPHKLPYLVGFEALVGQTVTWLVHKKTDSWASHMVQIERGTKSFACLKSLPGDSSAH